MIAEKNQDAMFLGMPYFQRNSFHESDQKFVESRPKTRSTIDVMCMGWIVFFNHSGTTNQHPYIIINPDWIDERVGYCLVSASHMFGDHIFAWTLSMTISCP